MNWILLLIVIVIAGLALNNNYSLDKGQHKKAKVIHAVLNILFFYLYVDTISYIIKLVQNFDAILNTTQGFGIISKNVHIILLIVGNMVGAVALWYFGKMLKRDNNARKIIIKILPVLGLISSIGFYRGFLEDGDTMGLSDGIIITLGLVLILGMYLGVMLIYKSNFMVRFFEMEQEKDKKSGENLGELIDEIGEEAGVNEKYFNKN